MAGSATSERPIARPDLDESRVICFVCKREVLRHSTREMEYRRGERVHVCRHHIKR